MSNSIISAAVQTQLDAVATAAAEAFVADRRSWEPVAAAFGVACLEADLPLVADGTAVNWEAEQSKAVIAYISPKILTALAKDKYYDLSVHRVGSSDEYLPVDADHEANYKITGSFAVTTNLNDLPSVKDSPRGLKAWLRGNAVNGLRPDGANKGLRDLINNNKDAVVSRLKKKEDARRSTAAKKDLVDKLLEVYKFLKGSRDKYEKDGGDCVTDTELKTYCNELADKVLKREPKKATKKS
jgi:hypothetical protein